MYAVYSETRLECDGVSAWTWNAFSCEYHGQMIAIAASLAYLDNLIRLSLDVTAGPRHRCSYRHSSTSLPCLTWLSVKQATELSQKLSWILRTLQIHRRRHNYTIYLLLSETILSSSSAPATWNSLPPPPAFPN